MAKGQRKKICPFSIIAKATWSNPAKFLKRIFH